MFWGTIHRMILIDLFKIFALALVALTSLILVGGVIDEAMKSGLGPVQIVMAIPLLLPSMLPYTVPTTTLFATCIVYGRLAAENEILALKAAGIHLIHVIWPAVALGLFSSTVTFLLYLDVIPYTHYLMKSRAVRDIEEILHNRLRRDGAIKHTKINYEIHVKYALGRKLLDVQFMRRPARGEAFDFIVRAKEGELSIDRSRKQIVLNMRHCHVVQGSGVVGFVDAGSWPVDLPMDLNGVFAKTRPTDMTWAELGEYEAKFRAEKERKSADIEAHQRAIDRGIAPDHFAAHVKDLIHDRKNLDAQIFTVQAESHMRLALALGCLCFAMVGCPVGIWISKSDYLSAFITCFLPIVTVYYPITLCLMNMTHTGKLPAWLGMYDSGAIMFLVGCVLFRQLMRK